MDIYSRKFIEYIKNKEINKFKEYLDENPDKLVTYDYKESDEDEFFIDILNYACENNNVEIVNIILQHHEKYNQKIYSNFISLTKSISRNKNIDVFRYFIDLINKYKNNKLDYKNKSKILFV